MSEPSPRIKPTRTARVMLTDDGRLTTGRLAGLTMNRAILMLAWPVLVENLLLSMVGLTDTYLAAQLGSAETDAVGGASYMTWFLSLIGVSLGVGSTALISRSVGKGRTAVANAALGQTVVLAGASGVVIGLLVYLVAPMLAPLLFADPEGVGITAGGHAFIDYLRVNALGVPFTSVLIAGTACGRGAGDSRRPLYAWIGVNIVNVVVSWLASGVDLKTVQPATLADGSPGVESVVLLHNPLSLDMGINGIALGTVLAHVVGCFMILFMARRGVWGIRLVGRRMRPHWVTMRRLVRLGLPNLFETSGMWLGNFLVILMVGMLGTDGYLGAHIIAVRIEALSFLTGFAMGMAAATLAGQYIGAGSPELARRAVFRCTSVAVVVMGTLGVGLLLFPERIVAMLSSQPVHLELVPPLLRIAGCIQVFFAIGVTVRAALRGAGDVRTVMAITWITTYAVRLPLAYALSGVDVRIGSMVIDNPFRDEPSLTWLWVGLCVELSVRAIIFTARFLSPAWTNTKV